MPACRRIRPASLALGLGAVLLLNAACRRDSPPPPKTDSSGAPVQATFQSANPDAPAAARASASLPPPVAEIVERYRKLIVVMADEPSLDEARKRQVAMVGRLLFNANREALEGLTGRLSGQLQRAVASGAAALPPELGAFLDTIEKSPALRDADKLVFRDLVHALADDLRALAPQGAARQWLARLDEDARALREIRSLYEKELDRIFGQLDTRGLPVHRERWESYLDFLRGLYSRDAILKEYPEETGATQEPGHGPREQAPRRPRRSLVIDGEKLPPMTLLLTFDDGPDARYTPRILETLEKYKVRSIFFEIGKKVGAPAEDEPVRETQAAGYTRQLLKAGHLLGNHTLDHAFMPRLGDEALAREIDVSRRILESASSIPLSLFRPPYGAHDAKVDAALEARNLKAFLWDVDSLDWADPIPKSVADRVVRQVESLRRGVILMHDIHSQSVEALPLILETLQQRGYQFVLWDGTSFTGESLAMRGPEVVPARTAAPLYRESHAVVVGINDYKSWPKLAYAVNDAQAIRDVLVNKFLFKPENVTLLLNQQATRERILSELGDVLADPERVKKDDRVFFFFAGHGTTRKLPDGRDLGYIVPVEADTKSFESQAISMTSFQDVSELIPAKHVFFVMDACYSGLALTRGGPTGGLDPRRYLEEVTRRVTREVLTAGGADEQVADRGPNGHSIFTWTVLQGLEGRADLNGDGYVTASELAAYVGPSVSQLSHQTPAFGSLEGSEGGEFVLELNHPSEFLTEQSAQLDSEAIQLNTELDHVRKLIAEKEAHNQQLQAQLASAEARLANLESGAVAARGAAPAAPTPEERARREGDRGMRLYREQKYPEALAAFQSAAGLNPGDAQAANNVGFLLLKLGRAAEAAPWLEKTIKLDPGRGPAYVNLGDAYARLGRRPEAAKAYGRYLELTPKSPLAEGVRKKLAQLK